MWSSLFSGLNLHPVRSFSVQAPHPKEEASVLTVKEVCLASTKVCHLDLAFVLWQFYQSCFYVLLLLHFESFKCLIMKSSYLASGTARKLLENFQRTLTICLVVTLDAIKVFSQISRIAFFFLLDKETYMLIESITNPRYSIFWVGMNWDFVGCITNPKEINNLIIFATFLKKNWWLWGHQNSLHAITIFSTIWRSDNGVFRNWLWLEYRYRQQYS